MKWTERDLEKFGIFDLGFEERMKRNRKK